VPVIIVILFIVHPLHTEVVANIKSRDEIFCMLFGFLSVYAALLYIERKNTWWLAASSIWLLLSIFSKETGYAYVLILLLIIYFFTDKPVSHIKNIILPLMAVVVFTIAIRMMVLESQLVSAGLTPLDNSLLAAKSYADRSGTTLIMLLHALKLLIIPVHLSWDHSYNYFPLVSWNDPIALLSFAIHLLLIGYATWKFRGKHILSFAILFYCTSYFITSNLVIIIGSSFGERFLFAPSLAFCIAIVVSLYFLLTRFLKSRPAHKKFTVLFSMPLIIFFIILTISRNPDWKNNESLLKAGVITSNASARVHTAYAKILMTKAESEDLTTQAATKALAMSEYETAISIYPDDFDTYYNMAILYSSLHDTANAIASYKKTIALNPKNNYAMNNLGAIYYDSRNYTEALKYFLMAIQIKPAESKAWGNAGKCYHNLKDADNASKYYEQALQLDPGNVDALRNIVILYQNTGNTVKAAFYRQQLQDVQVSE
jgi:Tfp pilus assembly protein PilF